MRPLILDDIVGQKDAFGTGSMLRSMLEQNKIPNMILWGPPGCGKVGTVELIKYRQHVMSSLFDKLIRLLSVMPIEQRQSFQ